MENKEYLFGFEKLVVWKDARDFITEIYELTDNFPFKERFGLSSQLKEPRFQLLQILQKVLPGSLGKILYDFYKYPMEV